jgi:hypothetical protein
MVKGRAIVQVDRVFTLPTAQLPKTPPRYTETTGEGLAEQEDEEFPGSRLERNR